MVEETDVFVIGGGPAGLAAAIAACRKGFRVTVADGAEPPIDKACGEGLLPDTATALRELGVDIRGSDGFALRGIRGILPFYKSRMPRFRCPRFLWLWALAENYANN